MNIFMATADEKTDPSTPSAIRDGFKSVHDAFDIFAEDLRKQLKSIATEARTTRKQVASLGTVIENLSIEVKHLSGRLENLDEATVKRSELHKIRDQMQTIFSRLDEIELHLGMKHD